MTGIKCSKCNTTLKHDDGIPFCPKCRSDELLTPREDIALFQLNLQRKEAGLYEQTWGELTDVIKEAYLEWADQILALIPDIKEIEKRYYIDLDNVGAEIEEAKKQEMERIANLLDEQMNFVFNTTISPNPAFRDGSQEQFYEKRMYELQKAIHRVWQALEQK